MLDSAASRQERVSVTSRQRRSPAAQSENCVMATSLKSSSTSGHRRRPSTSSVTIQLGLRARKESVLSRRERRGPISRRTETFRTIRESGQHCRMPVAEPGAELCSMPNQYSALFRPVSRPCAPTREVRTLRPSIRRKTGERLYAHQSVGDRGSPHYLWCGDHFLQDARSERPPG